MFQKTDGTLFTSRSVTSLTAENLIKINHFATTINNNLITGGRIDSSPQRHKAIISEIILLLSSPSIQRHMAPLVTEYMRQVNAHVAKTENSLTFIYTNGGEAVKFEKIPTRSQASIPLAIASAPLTVARASLAVASAPLAVASAPLAVVSAPSAVASAPLEEVDLMEPCSFSSERIAAAKIAAMSLLGLFSPEAKQNSAGSSKNIYSGPAL